MTAKQLALPIFARAPRSLLSSRAIFALLLSGATVLLLFFSAGSIRTLDRFSQAPDLALSMPPDVPTLPFPDVPSLPIVPSSPPVASSQAPVSSDAPSASTFSPLSLDSGSSPHSSPHRWQLPHGGSYAPSHAGDTPPSFRVHPESSMDGFQKPKGMKVVGLVFYGRPEYVEILDCYLRRNLVENGGFLDEVIFAVNTDDTHALEYLDELLAKNPSYRKHSTDKEYKGRYTRNWDAVEKDNIYIKIDDDIIFLEDTAIPAMVKRLIENPKYFAVSANSLNNPALSWVHFSEGVYEPYMPELTPPAEDKKPSKPSWRASELPPWEGPADYSFTGKNSAPFKGHRWLPLPKDTDIIKTPVHEATFDPLGPSWQSWAIAAQSHYSFLEHIEKGELWKYKFNVWDYHYARLSINFIAFWGKDLVDCFPFPHGDDEEYLTRVRPKELQRHVVVDGTAMTAHFGFQIQNRAHNKHGLTMTDLLSRYKAYADEMVCPFPKQHE